MILKKATYKAIKYACMKFHYAKTIPVTRIGFSVFNNKNEWCGVITYGGGANPKLAHKYGLTSGQYLELTRMALNGKQESTSKAMAISIKLIKKLAPTVELLISFADKGQNHLGIIYQATNWFFVDNLETSGVDWYWNGKWIHNRSYTALLSKINNKEKRKIFNAAKKRVKPGKFKYLYPLNKKMLKICKDIKLNYPKNAIEV